MSGHGHPMSLGGFTHEGKLLPACAPNAAHHAVIMAGAPRPEDYSALYGLEGLSPEQRCSRMALIDAHVPSGQLCISVGDELYTDGLHTLYRASTLEDMSGSAVRVLDRPSLMCAVHLAGSRKSGEAWRLCCRC